MIKGVLENFQMLRWKNTHKATNPKLISMAGIYLKAKNPWVPKDMSRCQTSFLRDVQVSASFQIYVCITKWNRNVLEKKQHREKLDSCVPEQQAARLRGVQRWRKGDQRNREKYCQASNRCTVLQLQKGTVKQSNGDSEKSGQQWGSGKAEGDQECSEILLWHKRSKQGWVQEPGTGRKRKTAPDPVRFSSTSHTPRGTDWKWQIIWFVLAGSA